jgi:hypothetical protein
MKKRDKSLGDFLKENRTAIYDMQNRNRGMLKDYTILFYRNNTMSKDELVILIDRINLKQSNIDYYTFNYQFCSIKADLGIDWGFVFDTEVELVRDDIFVNFNSIKRKYISYITRNSVNFFKIVEDSFESCYAQAKVIMDKYCYSDSQDNPYWTYTSFKPSKNIELDTFFAYFEMYNCYYKRIEVTVHHAILKDEMLYFIKPINKNEFCKNEWILDETYGEGKYISIIDEDLKIEPRIQEVEFKGMETNYDEKLFKDLE